MQARVDDLDRRLLGLLQSNAREPAATLARKLRIARTTVVARIARLERDGVIAGYGVRLGQRIEEAAVSAFCGITVNAKNAPQVMSALAGFPEVEEASAVSGTFDYMVLLRCADNEQLDLVLDRLGQMEGITQTHTSIVLSRKIDHRSGVRTKTD
jgi:DNA-binding Lrp family transcriptional regulator